MKRFAISVLFVFATSVSVASQFGLEQGASLEQLRGLITLKEVTPFVYSTSKVPNGHVAFDDYRLLVTPKQGLCKIVAWTPSISSSAYGDGIKTKFSTLFDALTSKYGNSKKFDFLRSGSIWDEPRDWMMGLAKGDRTLNAYWDAEEKSALPEDIQSITLQAAAVSSDIGIVSLTYEFKNFGDCSAWIKEQQNSSL